MIVALAQPVTVIRPADLLVVAFSFSNLHSSAFPTRIPPVTTGPLASLADELGNLGDSRDDYYKLLDGLYGAEQGPNDKRGRYIPLAANPPGYRSGASLPPACRFYDRFSGGKSSANCSVRSIRAPCRRNSAGDRLPRLPGLFGDYPLLLRPARHRQRPAHPFRLGRAITGADRTRDRPDDRA